jgi:4-amino-4-deoxy-L-arabinose transferase-like glycosyltransferase
MPAVGATSVSESRSRWTPTDRMVLLALILVAVARSLAIILSPLELGVDEAQYWLWSTRFDFGYYTKPPLTSWIIGASHAVFGHHVWAVRLPAPWIHLATALVLWRAGCWLGGNAAGRWAALLWASLPAVAVGSFVISTDTPMLLFWSLGLLALVGATTGNLASRRAAMMAGAAFGAAMLSKYAAIFGVVGLALYWLPARFRARPSLAPADLVLFAVAMLVIASPNIIWNLANDLTTVRHLGDNANLDRQSYAPLNSLWFLAAQFATAGPVSFALMLGILRVRRGDDAGTLLLCLSVPVIAVIMLQAFLSEANANWALAAMPALVLWHRGRAWPPLPSMAPSALSWSPSPLPGRSVRSPRSRTRCGACGAGSSLPTTPPPPLPRTGRRPWSPTGAPRRHCSAGIFMRPGLRF